MASSPESPEFAKEVGFRPEAQQTTSDMSEATRVDPATTNGAANAIDEKHAGDQSATPANEPAKAKSESDNQEKKDGDKKKDDGKEEKKPAGGFDDTRVPSDEHGYTLKFTFHRATNLPMADINSLSSDPYVMARLDTEVPMRHKEDPYVQHRTFTVRRDTNPTWDADWIVANVPRSGFKLRMDLYDEDPADHDDKLGHATIEVGRIDDNWRGLSEEMYKIHKRTGSKRAYLVRLVAACFSKTKHLNGHIYVSVENLGRTEGEGGRVYTLGPCDWSRHFSPLLGRLVNTRDPNANDNADASGKGKPDRYNFQANQFQLRGPVPADLYHRYVEFRPFVKGMFTHHGIRGYILHKALHHQHERVYNFDRTTQYGSFEKPCDDMTLQFLDAVHWDEGGRIFTYVLTLDALMRFTETGKEFGIDLLSKHTMHSDVSIYIAFSGEFFIRRLKHSHLDPSSPKNPTHPPEDVSGGPPESDPPKDPSHYELIIDNDSGTYRPNAEKLPLLREFLERSFVGLKVRTLDCQKDEELMNKMKQEQRDRKKKEGDHTVYTQGERRGSVSSSDIEDLDDQEARAQGKKESATGASALLNTVKRDASQRGAQEKEHIKNFRPSHRTAAGEQNPAAKQTGQPSNVNGHAAAMDEKETNGHAAPATAAQEANGHAAPASADNTAPALTDSTTNTAPASQPTTTIT